jgi:uncharacterized membrane protein
MASVKIINPYLFVAFLFGCLSANGQTGKISGQVIDAQTQETLAGAAISVQRTQIKAMADMDGNFTFNLKPGIYKIEATLISYETIVTGIIEVKNNSKQEIKVLLNPVEVVKSKEAESIILKQLITQNLENKEA